MVEFDFSKIPDIEPDVDHATVGDSSSYQSWGKKGERAVLQYLKDSPNVERIRDLREDRTFWGQAIDFQVFLWDTPGKSFTVEAKTDTYLGRVGKCSTKNVLAELFEIDLSRLDEGKSLGFRGWALRSVADWFFFFAPHDKDGESIWQFKRVEFQRRVFQYFESVSLMSPSLEIFKRLWPPIWTNETTLTFNAYIPLTLFEGAYNRAFL